MPPGPKPRPIAERFWEKVERLGVDDCWPWLASTNNKGYGKFSIKARTHTGAHRVAFELATGTPPGKLEVLHSCDNPPCCNPKHLSLGTQAENMRQAFARGRLKNLYVKRAITARHGTRSMYNHGCRCAGCYGAEAKRGREYRAARSKEKALTKRSLSSIV